MSQAGALVCGRGPHARARPLPLHGSHGAGLTGHTRQPPAPKTPKHACHTYTHTCSRERGGRAASVAALGLRRESGATKNIDRSPLFSFFIHHGRPTPAPTGSRGG